MVRTLMALNRGSGKVGINAGKVFSGRFTRVWPAHALSDHGVGRALIRRWPRFHSFGIEGVNAYGLTETRRRVH